jgi:integrase
LGPVISRGKRPPTNIKAEAERHMATISSSAIPAERIVTLSDFVERIFLPWIGQHRRPSTRRGYLDIWEDHLKPLCGQVWLRETRTYHVQGWLDQIGTGNLSRNTLKHIKSVVSAIFTLAKQQNYFEGESPARGTATNPEAAEPAETYAYTLDEINSILAQLPEPAATAFAVAAYMGLRLCELQGLLWENYRNTEMHISRSFWNGRITPPKTRKSQAPVPVIRQLADRLELHRLRSGNPQSGPIFANSLGKVLHLGNVVNRLILPSLNRCEVCLKAESNHHRADHDYKRDSSIPEWHGWHAARRGLGSNLYKLGVPEKVIQRILRHANVSTTAAFYIKTTDEDVLDAMARLEDRIEESALTQTDTFGTPDLDHSESPATIQ